MYCDLYAVHAADFVRQEIQNEQHGFPAWVVFLVATLLVIAGMIFFAMTGTAEGQTTIKVSNNKISVQDCISFHDLVEQSHLHAEWIALRTNKAYPKAEADGLISIENQYAQLFRSIMRYSNDPKSESLLNIKARIDALNQSEIQWSKTR